MCTQVTLTVMKMSTRINSVSPAGNGNGPNHDALRDIRKQMETNNKKNDAVCQFTKRILFFTVIFLIMQLMGWIGCIAYLFSEHKEGNFFQIR